MGGKQSLRSFFRKIKLLNVRLQGVRDLKKRLAEKAIGLKLDTKVRDFLIEKGFDPKNGARPLRRAIEDNLETLLSDAIIAEEILPGQIAQISLKGDKLKLKVESTEK